MFRLEMYAILARDRQREVLEQARTNALLRERKIALEAVAVPSALHQRPPTHRRRPGLAEVSAAEGNR